MDEFPENGRDQAVRSACRRIQLANREIGALGEVLQLLEGQGGPVDLEPDCLGVIGGMLARRSAEILEAVTELERGGDRGQ